MSSSSPRQPAPRPSRQGFLLESPRAEEGTAVKVRTVRVPSSEEAASLSSMPTLDDFGGRSDALGG